MAGDDLKEHATSSHDFYDLLGVTFETSETDIRRAYRKAALKYHPDKNAGKPEVVEKFHLLQIAYDVLSDPAVKALYDNARRARKDKEERDQAFEGKRKKMKEDLERRESGFFKRKRDDEDAQEKFDRELRRLAEDGQRRRREMQEKVNRERLEEEERLDNERNGHSAPSDLPSAPIPQGGTSVSEINRTVKVRWAKEGGGESIDKHRLITMFETFGAVENVFLLKDKRIRDPERKTKTLVGAAGVVFTSVVGAHAAIEDYKKQADPDFRRLQSVFWAANEEPDFVRPSDSANQQSAPTTPLSKKPRPLRDIPGIFSTTPNDQNGLRKAPSFASFSPASLKTPQTSSSSARNSDSPSFEELTMIRLKNAEKKRLEEQIRKQEAEGADQD